MPISLYAATIPQFLQMLGSVTTILDKAETHCANSKIVPAKVIEARLWEDMHPFSYQIWSAVTHSGGAIEGIRRGTFSPNLTPPPATFPELRAAVAQAEKTLAALEPSELDALVGRDMLFEFGTFRLEFTVETFLLSFSQPNFYFHVTTAYNILRSLGIAVGKGDYLGKMQVTG